jgi:hypothetical protein
MVTRSPHIVPPGLEELLGELFPGSSLIRARLFGADSDSASESGTAKAAGYGEPLRLTLRDAAGGERELVLHTASANQYGHDRRADRADELLLAFDTFPTIPDHIQALDVGAIRKGGRLVSLRDAGELYLLTTYAPGRPYASDLRRIAQDGVASDLDRARCDALAKYLARLHVPIRGRPLAYRRAIRDLIGHGEGIFGVVDGYPVDTPAAPAARLRAFEARSAEWRWRLRDRSARLSRSHGDFHPFNVVFAEGAEQPTALDASRGCAGDPADDVTCMALNYVFFALDRRASWKTALGPLWRRFWARYFAERPDPDLLGVAPPFLAWRALVIASPDFYPALPAASRDKLLGLAERALEAGALSLDDAERLFP